MEDRYSNLSESDITLICFGITLTFFSSNKEKLHKVLEIIKEKKLLGTAGSLKKIKTTLFKNIIVGMFLTL